MQLGALQMELVLTEGYQMKMATLCFCLFLAASLSAWLPQGDSRGPDGNFHDPETGAVQPDQCDNSFKNKTPCTCEKAQDKCDTVATNPGAKCKTYCRIHDCHCLNSCSS
jgi:hypothetical protein